MCSSDRPTVESTKHQAARSIAGLEVVLQSNSECFCEIRTYLNPVSAAYMASAT